MTEYFLNQVKIGKEFICVEIPESIKSELIRLGICEGDTLACIAKIPAGPVILKKDLSEIAIGNNYSKLIKIKSNEN
jgi:ferrous iron transport protein A